MNPSYSNVTLNRFFQHSTVLITILLVVRTFVLRLFVETDLIREFVYLISMGVSFFINWLVLCWLFKVGKQSPSGGTR